MTHVILGLGANLGDPMRQLAEAVDALNEIIRVDAVSSVYRTAPVGFADQPDFLNLVVAGDTDRSAAALLRETMRIEARMGRRREVANGPRTIDIDLLAYGDSILSTAALTVPHPRMHERAFVLYPLAEIRPVWTHPISGRTAQEMLSDGGANGAVARVGPLAPAPPPG